MLHALLWQITNTPQPGNILAPTQSPAKTQLKTCSFMPWNCTFDFGVQWQKPVDTLSLDEGISLSTDWLLAQDRQGDRSTSDDSVDRLVKCKFCLFLDLSFKIKRFSLKALCQVAYRGKLAVSTSLAPPITIQQLSQEHQASSS